MDNYTKKFPCELASLFEAGGGIKLVIQEMKLELLVLWGFSGHDITCLELKLNRKALLKLTCALQEFSISD